MCDNLVCKIDSCEVPYGTCHCGCGGLTNIYLKNNTKSGFIKGEPRLYLLGHHSKLSPFSYVVVEKTGCWEWQGGKTVRKNNSGGYGILKHKGKMFTAHRFYYEQKYGKVPSGLDLDHFKCQNPS